MTCITDLKEKNIIKTHYNKAWRKWEVPEMYRILYQCRRERGLPFLKKSGVKDLI